MRRPTPDAHGNHSANGSSAQPAARRSASLLRFALLALVIFLGLGGGLLRSTRATGDPVAQSSGKTYQPVQQEVVSFSPLNFREAGRQQRLNPEPSPGEIKSIDPPKDRPDVRHGVPVSNKAPRQPNAPPSSGTGISPGPVKTFKAEFLSGTTIPPDTMGAVGTTHVVTATNDRLRIQTRDGVEVSRMTITSFWAGVTIKGAAISAFDTKVYFDRFNNRFILISSGNGTSVNSGAMFAVSATADPTGVWYRWSVVADPASTSFPGGNGNWIDYPSVGFNKNWIVIDENVFHYTCGASSCANQSYWGQQIYVLDKQAAYSNTLSTINLFSDPFTNCVSPFESALGCGFTMAPAITEDNTTDTEYLVEDWDSTAGQLRLSKITGTPSAPVLTIGTQFPQSSESWRFDAARIGTANNCGGTCSGGYMPQRQQSANLPSGSRIAANDSRIQNAVLRNGKLWTTHTVMLAAASQAAGTTIGGTGNPVDNHSGIQWWQIDPTNETAASTPPLQRGRIQDPTANNCHNGSGGTSAVAPCNGTTSAQFGTFLAFPNISVNQNEDVLIGFSQFSPLTYPSAAYAIRRAADPANTTRDIAVFRPGQSNYNIGSGSGTARNDRWGDYSSAQTDPLNDIDFWTVQEYAGTNRNDFLAPSYAGPWETWWALINPGGTMPSPSGSLIISEFRLRGPQGVRDEFVELYNPGNVPVIVQTTDNSDGWALVYSTNGTTISQIFAVIPNGTVIKPHGHFLVTDNPDNTAGGTSALTYSLNGYPGTQVRGADSDFGWSLDLADNGGIALFNTATQANFASGTRLDSVGFSSIAAGLFKEGNGIPAITAATPTGQMTFFRDLASGTPKDTGANENDFIFANTVVGETLGSAPRLGAAGPENLGSPINAPGTATMATALLDTGVGAGSAPNRFRDITPVANGALGTLTFRRTFTNNTGLDLPRLRFRVVDLTTNPPAATKADLRVLSAGAAVVSLSGGGTANVGGTTLETPPAQAAGGGFNGTLNVPGLTLATPLTAGSTINLQFVVGVQVQGTFNFCLVPESDPPVSLGPLCFSGTTENMSPVITGGSLSLNAGASATGTTVATVTDDSDAAGSLTVMATSVPSGITITNIMNAGGSGTASITADVSADCSLTTGAYNVTLKVTDSEMATNTATFTINVTATPAPTTPTITADTNGTGTQDQACPEVPLTLHANSTGATSYQWYKDIDLLPGETNSTYQATGAATYYVTATNACGTSAQSAGYVVQNPTPHSPFVSFRGQDSSVTTLAICQGSSQIIDSDSATGIQWYKDGIAIPGANSQSYTATQAGVYTAQLNALGCHSQFGRNVTITVDAMPPTPTISGDTNGTGTQDQACPEQPLTLHANGATGATSYTWYTDNAVVPSETTSTLVVTSVGNYSVTATNGTCTTPHSATYVVQNPTPHSPFISIRGQASTTTSITICQGSSVILDSDSATGIQWYKDNVAIPGAGQMSYTFTPSMPGTYTLTAQLNALGCHSQFGRNITVTVTPTPATPTVTPGGPTTFCQGGSVTLTSSSASGNQWYLNNSPIGGATGNTYNATASGSYTVVVTTNGCSSAPSAATTVTATPPPTTATVGPNQTIVPGGTTAPLGGNTPTSGMGTWTVRSGGTGTFSGVNSGSSTFTHTGGAGPIVLRWTISNPPCPDSFAELTVNVGVPPTITCPTSPVVAAAATGQCGTTVNYTVTATGAPTPTVVCAPPSGASFPVGQTTVSCTATNGVAPNAACSFIVKVTDTQPPVFTNGCPAAITTVTTMSCPPSTSQTINYSLPQVSDNCPGASVACVPPSGSVFALGTTSVTCTATDAAGNTATCSFPVNLWSGCLQDETNPGNVCLFNAQTGQYQFCCNGQVTATGTGTLTVRGCIISISHTKGDRRVQLTADITAKRGTATIQIGSKTICQITDQNVLNNACQCPLPTH